MCSHAQKREDTHPGLFSLTPSYFVPDNRFPSLNSFSLFRVSLLLWPLPTLHLLPFPLSTPMISGAQLSYSISLAHSETGTSIYYMPSVEMSRYKGEQDTVLCPLTAHHLIEKQMNKNSWMQCERCLMELSGEVQISLGIQGRELELTLFFFFLMFYFLFIYFFLER